MFYRTSMNITTSVYIQTTCTANMVLSSFRSMATILAVGISQNGTWKTQNSYVRPHCSWCVVTAVRGYIYWACSVLSQVFCSISWIKFPILFFSGCNGLAEPAWALMQVIMHAWHSHWLSSMLTMTACGNWIPAHIMDTMNCIQIVWH